MREKRYQALILDMDGTLLDSRAMVVESLARLGEEYGVSITIQQYPMAFGCPSEELMERVGLPAPLAAAQRWREIMGEMLDRVTLYPGVAEVLAAPIRRGLVTSQTRQELTANLAVQGIGAAFAFTVSVEEAPRPKPEPDPLLRCLEAMGLSAEEALYVGDTAFDYQCARAAGVDFGLACWGAEDPEAFPRARYHFRRPEEMLPLVQNLDSDCNRKK